MNVPDPADPEPPPPDPLPAVALEPLLRLLDILMLADQPPKMATALPVYVAAAFCCYLVQQCLISGCCCKEVQNDVEDGDEAPRKSLLFLILLNGS